MAIKGPDIHFDHGWAAPIQVDGDSTVIFTDETVTFRWGLPSPSGGALVAELGSIVLLVVGARRATGTVPRADTRIDPTVVYGYNVSVGEGEDAYLVCHGRLVVSPSVGGGG
jgi:hypothetical protein